MCDGHVLNYYMNGQLMAYIKNGMNIVDEAYMFVYYRHVYNCLYCVLPSTNKSPQKLNETWEYN